ncbi:MAG: hypothetical protein IKR48_03305 [Kiritimatiellae bacterium]|nr:hypothetical protein [Kiritimatiellia bacterium]
MNMRTNLKTFQPSNFSTAECTEKSFREIRALRGFKITYMRMAEWFFCVLCFLPMAARADMAYPKDGKIVTMLGLMFLWAIVMPWIFFTVLFKRRRVGGILACLFGLMTVIGLYALYSCIFYFTSNYMESVGKTVPFWVNSLIGFVILWAVLYPFFRKKAGIFRTLVTSFLVAILFDVLFVVGTALLLTLTWR